MNISPWLQILVATVWCVPLAGCGPDDHATGVIEKKYGAAGPWAVTKVLDTKCCDSRGNSYDIYYPTNLAGISHHPIITWGNGTGGRSDGAAFFLTHLASWGFVVIATRDRFTADGTTILDAARFMVSANGDPQSAFHNKLDTNRIGAVGHPQGAGGAIRAMIKSNGAITTTAFYDAVPSGVKNSKERYMARLTMTFRGSRAATRRSRSRASLACTAI